MTNRGRIARLCAVVVLTLGMAVPGHALPSWQSVFEGVRGSLVRLEINDADGTPVGLCTAFAISETGMFGTAAHCFGMRMHVGAHMALPVYYSPALDLMVLSIPGIKVPALDLCRIDARTGDDIAAVGFAAGEIPAAIRTGAVMHGSILKTVVIGDMFSSVEFTAEFLEVDFALIGGMSGGPMVNRNGCVWSVNQAGTVVHALGRPTSVIRSAIGSYFE